jgi:hypothetical protein
MRLSWIYVLSVVYLSLSSLLFLIFWIKTPLSVVFISCYIFSISYFIKNVFSDENLVEKITFAELSKVILLSAFILIITGSGGFSYQVFDYTFHNSKFSDVANLNLPVHFESVSTFGTYYYGYYLTIGVLQKIFNFENFSLLIFLWSLLGVSLGLSWIYYILNKNFYKLITLFFVGGLFSFFYTFFYFKSEFFTKGYTSFSEMKLNYAAILGNLAQVPNQSIPVFIVIPILLFEIGRNNNFSRPIHLVSSMLFWSPFTFLSTFLLFASSFLYKLFVFQDFKPNWKALVFESLINILAFSPIIIYLLSVNGNIDSGFFTKYESNYLIKWSMFVFLEVYILYFFAIRQKLIPNYFLVISVFFLSLIPIYKFGIGNDFCMRASMPFTLILYLAFAVFFIENKRHILITSIFIIGAIIPIKIVGRGLTTFNIENPQKINYHEFEDTYEATRIKYSKKSAEQLLMSKDSFFEKYLIKKLLL